MHVLGLSTATNRAPATPQSAIPFGPRRDLSSRDAASLVWARPEAAGFDVVVIEQHAVELAVIIDGSEAPLHLTPSSVSSSRIGTRLGAALDPARLAQPAVGRSATAMLARDRAAWESGALAGAACRPFVACSTASLREVSPRRSRRLRAPGSSGSTATAGDTTTRRCDWSSRLSPPSSSWLGPSRDKPCAAGSSPRSHA